MKTNGLILHRLLQSYLFAFSFLLVLFLSVTGCSENNEEETEDPTIQELELSITPQGRQIEQTEALTLVARITPVPDNELHFEWRTNATYGKIRPEEPFGEIDEFNTIGKSEILYSATPVGNSGGTEKIYVRILDSSGNKLVEESVEVEVGPPGPQTITGEIMEYTTDGTIPGHLNTVFLTAFIFYELPGFNIYEFTVKEPAGEGWDLGDEGDVMLYSLNNGLVDEETFIANYGSDLFNLGFGENKFALLFAGPSATNYDPNDSGDLEILQRQRESVGRLAQAQFVVTPHPN